MFFDSAIPTSATPGNWTTPAAAAKKSSPGLRPPPRGDPYGSVTNLFTPASDWISYKTVVSTPDDQIALRRATCSATGTPTAGITLPMTWADVKILDFFTYISGRYDVKSRTTRASTSRSTTTPTPL